MPAYADAGVTTLSVSPMARDREERLAALGVVADAAAGLVA